MLSSLETKLSINKREVYRYLGYKEGSPDPDLEARVDQCIAEVQEASEPLFRSFLQTRAMKSPSTEETPFR